MGGEIHIRIYICETLVGPESLGKQRWLQLSSQSIVEEGPEWREKSQKSADGPLEDSAEY